jgi:hypothetical protein
MLVMDESNTLIIEFFTLELTFNVFKHLKFKHLFHFHF